MTKLMVHSVEEELIESALPLNLIDIEAVHFHQRHLDTTFGHTYGT